MSTDGEDIYFKEFDTADNNGIAKDLDGQIVNGIYGILEFKDLKLTAMWKDHEKEIPSAPFNAEFNEYHTQFTQSEFVDLSWSPRISFDKFLILKATTDHQKYGAQVPFPFGLNVEFLGETTTWSSGLQFIWDIFPNNRIISGAEYTDNFKSNYKYFAEDVDLVNDTWSYKLFSLFFQNEYQYNADLSIYFGVRRDDFVGQEVAVNPRAGIVYSLKGEHTFKLLYGRSYRAPNLLERNLEEKNIARFKANENLKSEFINTAELIWNYKIHKNLSTSVAFYLYKMEDLIEQVEDPIDDLFQYVNKSTIYAQGVELELNYEINSFSSYIRYSFQEAKDNAKIKISNSPTHLFKVGAVHKLFGIFNVALDANLESKRKTLYNTYTAPSFLVNANLFTDKFYDNLSCSFSIRNMLNEKIMHPAGYELRQRTIVQPYRNYTFSLSYEF
jgi:iron complex outermembrane receptor protein